MSYRRSDAAGHARFLHRELAQYFDPKRIFFDRESIESGNVFPDRLREALADAKVVLSLIGPDRLGVTNSTGRRRLDDPQDLVRLELTVALEQGKRVIPVLFDGAAMPSADSLPDDLKPLAARDAQPLGGKTYEYDRQFAELVKLLAAAPGMPQPMHLPETVPERPYRRADQMLSPHFSGRADELRLLNEGFEELRGTDRPVIRALWGMGGSGKTQVALEYTRDHLDRYAGVWWVRAEETATLEADFVELVADCRVPKANEREPARDAVRRWLARQPIWLLVFDNAEDAGQLRPYLPDRGAHDVVITSRNPAWGGIARPIGVKPWGKVQGVAFLGRRLPVAPAADAERLWKALDGLPLALEQAAAFIEETGSGVADYCAALAEVDAGAAVLDKGSATTGYPHTVSSTVALAFGRLSAPAGRLLRLLGWLAPEPVPESVFRERPECLPQELRDAATRPLGFDEAIGELRRFGLADRLGAAATRRETGPRGQLGPAIRVHRLTQAIVRARLSNGSGDARIVLNVLLAAFPDDPETPAAWPASAALVSHVRYPIMRAAAEQVEPAQLAVLLNKCGRYELASGSLGAALESLSASLAVRRRVLGDEHRATLSTMNNLGVTMRAQGDFASARGLHEKVIDVTRRVLGEDHPDTLTSMDNLATALRGQGDLAGARSLQEKVVTATRRVLGEDHPDTLTSMDNLAQILLAQGNLTGARGLQEKVVDVTRRTLGDEHVTTLKSMNNLAVTLGTQGDLTGACGLLEKVIDIASRVLGDEHPVTLSGMNNLADTMRARGDLAGARGLQRKTLDVRRRVLGDEHPATLATMVNVAEILRALGDLAGARELQEKALENQRRALGEEHPDTLTSMDNLAGTLSLQGDLAGARELHERTFEGRRQVLGDEHPATLVSMNNLAEILHAQGDLSGARDLHERVLASHRRVLGDEHPATLTSMTNLAETLRAQGDLASARGLQEKALDVSRRILGKEHPDTTVSAWNLFATLRQMGMVEAADNVYRDLLAWLLSSDGARLSVDQRRTRGMVAQLLQTRTPNP